MIGLRPLHMLADAAAPGLSAAGWQTMSLIFAGIIGLMFAVRLLGLYLAATHPEPLELAKPALLTEPTIDPKILAVIAATVSQLIPEPHRLIAVKKAPSVESLMQQWSMEGRRAIYSSHKFR